MNDLWRMQHWETIYIYFWVLFNKLNDIIQTYYSLVMIYCSNVVPTPTCYLRRKKSPWHFSIFFIVSCIGDENGYALDCYREWMVSAKTEIRCCLFKNELRELKGIWNEKFGLKKTLLFERTFEIIKIGLHSSRVSHFSLEIFGFIWYVDNSTAYVTLHNDFFRKSNISLRLLR